MLEQIMPPALEPVSVQELKNYLRLDHDEEDLILARLIKVARETLEKQYGLQFIAASWRYRPKQRPKKQTLHFPLFPIKQVDHIKLYLEDGSVVLFDPSNAVLDSSIRPATLSLLHVPRFLQENHAIEITFIAGYGAQPEQIPEKIRLAVTKLAASYYENRGMACGCDQMQMSASVASLLHPLKEVRLI